APELPRADRRLILRGDEARLNGLRAVQPDHHEALAEQFFVRYFPDLPRRISHDHGPWRHVADDHGAGADIRLLADFHAGAQHGRTAHARAATDRRPLDQLVPPLGAA